MTKRRKKVVIDVNSAMPLYSRGWLSGIGRTTKELVESMDSLGELPYDIVLYSQNTKCVSGKELGTSFVCKHLSLPHKEWMNRIVSLTRLREISTHYDLLHVPHNFEYVCHPEKTVITLHDAMFFAFPDETFDYESAQKKYPRLARKCKGIITCSESSKKDIMRYMDVDEKRIYVCQWGYNDRLFYRKERKKTGYPYFLSVSCSLGRKNTMAIVKAYEKLVRNNPTHELVLVWPNTPREVVEYCNQEHLRNHIYISTDIDDERLSVLYNEATATFFTSRYEGFGLPLLESMACGTPVVTCNNSSLPEVGGDVAIYVDPDDIDGISKCMERFENREYDYESLQNRCEEQAHKFSWRKCAEQTARIYQDLVEA